MPEMNHKDALGRVSTISSRNIDKEHFLQPKDGRLEVLKVQCLQDKPVDIDRSDYNPVISRNEAHFWGQFPITRSQENCYPVNQTPILIRILHWIYPHGLDPQDDRRNAGNYVLFCFRYVAACFAILICLCFPTTIENETKNDGCYDAIVYKDWRYPKVSRNNFESRSTTRSSISSSSSHTLKTDQVQPVSRKPVVYIEEGSIPGGIKTCVEDDESYLVEREVSNEADKDRPFLNRILRPRYLCFLRKVTRSGTDILHYEVKQVSEDDPDPKYVFISYTRAQFWTSNADDTRKMEIDQQGKDARLSRYKKDRAAILRYGIRAAYEANVDAFWLDFKCIPRKEGQKSSFTDEIYNISDVVRAAHSMVIVTGWPLEGAEQHYDDSLRDTWLRIWGSRIWTLPEILLCPAEHHIKVYARGEPDNAQLALTKRNLALRAWEDAHHVRQLLDHFESLQLSRLELSSIALSCFRDRKSNYGYAGDVVYSLMGLFRLRPKVDVRDSEFEAFARLSMANDSDKLLERLICMLPPSKSPEWHQMKDHWEAMLWDIEPHCQIAGIVDDRTVTLDGAFAASIQWDSLEPVAFLKRRTIWRAFMKVSLRILPSLLFSGITALAWSPVAIRLLHKTGNTIKSVPGLFFILIPTIGAIMCTASLSIAVTSPIILWDLCGGKFWGTQASLYGIEGNVDLGVVEKYLFGLNCGRLHWSAHGSDLSRHNEANEAIGGECRAAKPGAGITTTVGESEEKRLFTLIDTLTMTAFQFRTMHPPTAAIVCGREGGMQRAILCSYHWPTATYCRETVLRMETVVLDRMRRMPRFRFAFSRPSGSTAESGE